MADTFSLQELADRTGMQPRTIRSYIEQGLLRGPETLGRHARYGREHLDRLLAIVEMRDYQNLALSDIRGALLTMSDEDIRAVAERAEQRSALLEAADAGETAEGTERRESALRYLRRLKGSMGGAWAGRHKEEVQGMVQFSSRPASPAERAQEARETYRSSTGAPSALEKLVAQFSVLAPGRQVRRRAKGVDWVRIQVTPDIEIHVRRELAEKERAAFELMADYMREVLLGGSEDEQTGR